MANVRINKWLDLIDRAGWTAIEASAGAVITAVTVQHLGWKAALSFVGSTTLVAVCKVVIAQRSGSDDLGAAVPGQVIEPK